MRQWLVNLSSLLDVANSLVANSPAAVQCMVDVTWFSILQLS